jgi:hypothetical protein
VPRSARRVGTIVMQGLNAREEIAEGRPDAC